MALTPERQALLPEIVAKFETGEYSLRQLESEFGVADTTIYRWLLTELGEERYREVVTNCLVARVAEADRGLRTCATEEVQRWSQIARYARMDFERRRPHLYGVKQEVKHTVVPVLHIHAPMPAEKVVAGPRVPSALPAPGREE